MNPEPLPTIYRVEYNPAGPPYKRWVVWQSNPWSQNSFRAASTHSSRLAAEKAVLALREVVAQ